MAKATTQTATKPTAPVVPAVQTKPTAPVAGNPVAPVAAVKETKVVDSGIDLTKLTPAQLAALQKQLKAKGSALRSKKDERFAIIDAMLKEKDKAGAFLHTTREIMTALVDAKLVDTTPEDYDQIEIKKIQARKQFLEKKTDEKGVLVYAKNTFGYRPSEGGAFGLSPVRVVKFFQDAEQLKTLNAEGRAAVLAALEASE